MDYEILLKNQGTYGAIVLSCSYERLSEFFSAIQLSLREIRFKGPVLLDYFGCNGNTSNRFAEIYFDGEQLVRETLTQVSSLDYGYIHECNSFFQSRWESISTEVVDPTPPCNPPNWKVLNKTKE